MYHNLNTTKVEGINKIFCGTNVKNTGKCECYFDVALIVGSIKVPKNKVFTEEELADANIAATMQAAILAAKASRIYPYGPFEQITDGSEEPVRQTFGYGTVKTVREGKYIWSFQFLDGGLNLSNALRSFNGLHSKYSEIFITADNTLIGTARKDANGEWGMAGVPQNDFYANPWKAPDGSNVAGYMVGYNFNPVYVNEKIAFKRVSVDSLLLSELNGLEDIELNVIGDLADGASEGTFGGNTDCGSTNLYELYKAELAQATAWVVKDSVGNTKAITSVTADDEAEGWVIALTGPAVFEDGDTVQLAAPSVLAATPINVQGYESDVLTLDLGS